VNELAIDGSEDEGGQQGEDFRLLANRLRADTLTCLPYGLSLVKRLRRVRSLKMTKAKKARMQTKATW